MNLIRSQSPALAELREKPGDPRDAGGRPRGARGTKAPWMRASLVGRGALVGELVTPPAGVWGLRSPLACAPRRTATRHQRHQDDPDGRAKSVASSRLSFFDHIAQSAKGSRISGQAGGRSSLPPGPGCGTETAGGIFGQQQGKASNRSAAAAGRSSGISSMVSGSGDAAAVSNVGSGGLASTSACSTTPDL